MYFGFMPAYDYQCDSCLRTFEVRQRITEPALTTCEVCGGHVRRLLAAAPFILKGGGWYVTDYPSESRKQAQKSESSSSTSSATSSATDGKSSTQSSGDSSTSGGTSSNGSSGKSSSAGSSTPPASGS
jgi:putative FmdB family regulatory protein